MNSTKPKEKDIRYCGYFPFRILRKLKSVATIKIMVYILTKLAMNKNMNAISIQQKDVLDLNRTAYYRGLKDLEKDHWIWVDRTNRQAYKVTIHQNYLTNPERNFLEGKRRK